LVSPGLGGQTRRKSRCRPFALIALECLILYEAGSGRLLLR